MLSAQYTFVIATKKLDTHLFSEKIEFANDLHIGKRQRCAIIKENMRMNRKSEAQSVKISDQTAKDSAGFSCGK